jgi:cyclic-di-GMP-binding protein
VRRHVSLKALEDGKIEEAQKGTARQHVAIKAGISADHAKRLNKFIKDLGLKGISSQTQGDQLRVSGKKRDDLQEVIAKCKAEDFGIPLQFENFRD